ncbi:N-acetylmuramoyl-L-alanine amidase family protein [Niabella digestorum]|uniref:N-acetylmuramoyl-L-alanine amidase n=1 Tax=Niabella digestorum TaxID=3117701 RepID=A0ABU7REZ7_9BACT
MRFFGYCLGPLLCFLVSCIFVSAQNPSNRSSVNTIIIDAGHGGTDVGARGTITNEATITLAVAKKLVKAMREEFPNIKILETRPTEAFPGNTTNSVAANRYRAEFANANNGDLFISLHCNAAGKKPGGWYAQKVVGREARTRYVKKGKKRVKQTYYVNKYANVWVENTARGTETYIWAVNKNDQKVSSIGQVSQDNNEEGDYYNEETEDAGADTLALPDPNDPAERARMLIYAQHYFRKSYALATLVEKEFVASGRVSRGVQQRNHKGIWVLQATGMPSILVEMGFISNNDEQAYMMSEEGQNTIVRCIINAVKTYIEKYG